MNLSVPIGFVLPIEFVATEPMVARFEGTWYLPRPSETGGLLSNRRCEVEALGIVSEGNKSFPSLFVLTLDAVPEGL